MAERLNLPTIRRLPVCLPSLPSQRTIAHILGTLDDKIELNRRTNRTLEEIARTLFKSWFVDFDPVRAKAEGRPPEGMDAETAALFPDAFEESELGPIPKGWRAGVVADLVEINPRVHLAKGAIVKWVEMRDVPTQGPCIQQFSERSFSGGSKFENGDTLLARITPCLENGKTAMVDFLDEREVGGGSTEFLVMRSHDEVPPEWVYCLARDERFRSYAIAHMTGSSGRQRVPSDAVSRYETALPNEEIIRGFGNVTHSLFEKLFQLNRAARTLADIRDTLLPKLLSGDLRIDDPEKFLEENVP